MSSDEKQASSVDICLDTPDDSPELLASPKGQDKPDTELLAELLANKAALSDPSDLDQPPSVHPESSGSEQYSDEKDVSKAHSRLHSRGRPVSDFHGSSTSKMRLPPSSPLIPTVSEPTDKATPTQNGSHRASRSHTTSPGHSSAPSTPSADNTRTYSFVFTSSRQHRVLGGDRLIGVVNPSSLRSVAPKAPPRPQNTMRNLSLTPEQIKAHALGAVHATPEDSPFAKRDHSVPLVTPIEIPLKPSFPLTPTSPSDAEKSMQTIDYYVNAARAGRSTITEGPSSPRPALHRRSLSYTASLPALGEHSGPAIFKETSTPSQSEQSITTRPKRKKSRAYARYIESESSEYSFTSNTVPRPRGQSYDSSTSSSNSKASFDESITGLSCFGVIGSGSPSAVFGNAVMSARRSKSGSASGDQRPALSQTSSTSTSTSDRSQTVVAHSASEFSLTPVTSKNNIAQNAAIHTPQ